MRDETVLKLSVSWFHHRRAREDNYLKDVMGTMFASVLFVRFSFRLISRVVPGLTLQAFGKKLPAQVLLSFLLNRVQIPNGLVHAF